MMILKTAITDLDAVMAIYACARKYMRESGNARQWGDDHPPKAFIEEDIRRGESYVCVDESGEIQAIFMLTQRPEPDYMKIDGAWVNDAPYTVIHRIARRRNAKGAGAFCLNWCYENFGNLRIDTHRDNAPMLKLLDNLGFVYCGVIWINIGGGERDERLAFQKA